MTQSLSNPGWDISRTALTCASCNQALAPGQLCWALLIDQTAGGETAGQPSQAPRYTRLDLCEACWEAGRRPVIEGGEIFSFWKTSVPTPQQKKRLLVDDTVLADLFAKLESRTAPEDIQFRFVLALILMRKRLLRYDGIDPETAAAGSDVWLMTPRGGGGMVKVVDPRLTLDQISAVSQHLSQILAEEI
jgi:hypothetical protein